MCGGVFASVVSAKSVNNKIINALWFQCDDENGKIKCTQNSMVWQYSVNYIIDPCLAVYFIEVCQGAYTADISVCE